MPVAHFSRVVDDTCLQNLLVASQTQNERKCKPLHYETLIDLSLSISDFESIAVAIARPHPCYLPYAFRSVADNHGIWRCILVRNQLDDRKIVLYTAGRTFPLYAALIV
jgi:hypothetical protein